MADTGKPANLYEAVIALEKAKADSRPEAIRRRAEAKAAEIFTADRIAEIMQGIDTQIKEIMGGRNNE